MKKFLHQKILLPTLVILTVGCLLFLSSTVAQPEKPEYMARFEYPGFCDVVYLEIKNHQYTVSCKNFGDIEIFKDEYKALMAVEKALKNCTDPFDQYIGTIFLFDDTTEGYDCLDVWNRSTPIGRFCPEVTETDEYVYIYEGL